MLSAGKSSRLYKRLVYDEQIATDVDASLELREIGGLFAIEAGVRPGVDPAKVERALDEELARFLAAGPTPVELARAKTLARAGFIRGVERIGGFGGKSDVLAKGAGLRRPARLLQGAARAAWPRPPRRRCAARRRAGSRDGDYTLEVQPFPDYATAPTGADRSKLPEPGTPPEADSPRSSAPRSRTGSRSCSPSGASIPQVQFDLLLDAGFASDQFALPGHRQPGDEHARRGHHDPHRRSRSATGSPISAPISAPRRGSTSRACRSRR